MKNNILFSFFLLCAFVFSCDDDESSLVPSSNSITHAKLMGYQGKVDSVQVYSPEDDFVLLKAFFDVRGRCIRWNDTGVAIPQETKQRRGISSGWMSAPASYEYFYNDRGQLTAVHQFVLGGAIEHYKFTYGNHHLVLPSPIPIGTLQHFPLEGVTRIESENYLLTCDGVSAFSERHTLAWMSLTEKTEYLFENNRVVEQTMRLFGARAGADTTQFERVRTFFEYEGEYLKKTLEVAVDAEDYQEKFETVFSTQHPYMPEVKALYSEMAFEPVYATVYKYDAQGRITSVQNSVGEAYIEMPYTQEYLSFDEEGNWQTATRHTADMSTALQQTVGYW